MEIWLDSDDTAAGAARSVVDAASEGAPTTGRTDDGAEPIWGDAMLVASELVANAVEHGDGARVRLRLTRRGDDEVELSVLNGVVAGSDGVPERPWRMPGVDAIRGRGLAVVESISRHVGVVRNAGDVEVTAVVAV